MRRSPRAVWVEEQVRLRYSHATILDIGFVGDQEKPFVHIALRRQNPGLSLIGVDLNRNGVLAHRLPDTLAADGGLLPFRASSFDAVLCLEIFEHLHCPLRLFDECWRILKPHAELLVTTPNAWSWWNLLRHWMGRPLSSLTQRSAYRRYLGDDDHKQFYDPLSLMNLLDDAGFEPALITTRNHSLPVVRRWFRWADALDWQFYPMDRLGQYVCLVARKNHAPRTGKC